MRKRHTMQISEIRAADPNELINSHRAMELLGLSDNRALRDLIDNGEIALFLPATGLPNRRTY